MDNQQPSFNSGIFYRVPKKGYGFIYKYVSPSNKNYIGQTINSLKDRAKDIISGSGYKKCSAFWKAIKKYGWQHFQVEILEEVPINLLNDKEIEYIKKYNSLVPNGYNLTYGGEGGKCRDVYVYSAQNGKFIEHYSSLIEASLDTNIPIETISTILNTTRRKQTHNLVFLDHYIESYDINQLLRKTSRHIYVYDELGNYQSEFFSIVDAAKALNITDGQIRKCFNGLSAHVKNYQFRNEYFDNIGPIPKNSKSPISVLQIDPQTNEVIASYPSLKAASRAVGLSSGDGIKKVITRGKGLSGGYFWKIDEGSTTKCE